MRWIAISWLILAPCVAGAQTSEPKAGDQPKAAVRSLGWTAPAPAQPTFQVFTMTPRGMLPTFSLPDASMNELIRSQTEAIRQLSAKLNALDERIQKLEKDKGSKK